MSGDGVWGGCSLKRLISLSLKTSRLMNLCGIILCLGGTDSTLFAGLALRKVCQGLPLENARFVKSYTPSQGEAWLYLSFEMEAVFWRKAEVKTSSVKNTPSPMQMFLCLGAHQSSQSKLITPSPCRGG